MEANKMVALKVRKQWANSMRRKVKEMQIQGTEPLINENEYIMIPLRRELSEEEHKLLQNVCSDFELIQLDSVTSKKKVIISPFETLVTAMLKESNFDPRLVDLLPKKWEKLGHVVIIKKLDSQLVPFEQKIGESLLKAVSGATVVLEDENGITGELRTPKMRILIDTLGANAEGGSSTLATHIENGIKYNVDASMCMFSSGNGTERIHFANIDAHGEIIVDMFAGIGYFTLPLAVHGRPNCIYALEKNPNSFEFLQQNIRLNGVDHVKPILGDNRNVGNEALGQADRVLMGYIPTPKEFLQRAFSFLKSRGGIVHFHHVCKKEEYKTFVDRCFTDELQVWNQEHPPWTFAIVDFRVVKSYAPKLFHCVADVQLSNH